MSKRLSKYSNKESNKKIVNKFGSLLRESRRDARLTQKELVKKLWQAGYEPRYHESDISKWEHGRIPPEDVVEELEEILSIPKGLLLKAAGYVGAAEYRRIITGGGVKPPPPVSPHHEDIRKAIGDWLALMREPKPVFNPAGLGEPVNFGFGLTWQAEAESISAKLKVDNKQYYPILCAHLAPPVVDEGFWSQVEDLRKAGTDFLSEGRRFGREITKVSQRETGLGLATSWQHKPETGITFEFRETISRNALGIEQCTNCTYFELAIVYFDRGVMVTTGSEGVRLLQGQGFDPTFKTTYVSTAGAWVIPQGNQRLICDTMIELNNIRAQAISFVLQLHGHVIAVASLEEVKHCCKVHERLMQEFAGSPSAALIFELREKIQSISTHISAQLEKASLYYSFPGKCSFCPEWEGDS